MFDKKLKRNLIACCISLILINIMTGIMNLSFDKFQFGSVFMLLYLCITEILKKKFFITTTYDDFKER